MSSSELKNKIANFCWCFAVINWTIVQNMWSSLPCYSGYCCLNINSTRRLLKCIWKRSICWVRAFVSGSIFMKQSQLTTDKTDLNMSCILMAEIHYCKVWNPVSKSVCKYSKIIRGVIFLIHLDFDFIKDEFDTGVTLYTFFVYYFTLEEISYRELLLISFKFVWTFIVTELTNNLPWPLTHIHIVVQTLLPNLDTYRGSEHPTQPNTYSGVDTHNPCTLVGLRSDSKNLGSLIRKIVSLTLLGLQKKQLKYF